MGCAEVSFEQVWVTGAFCEWCSPYGGLFGGALPLQREKGPGGSGGNSTRYKGAFVFTNETLSTTDEGESAVFYRYLADGWHQPEAIWAPGTQGDTAAAEIGGIAALPGSGGMGRSGDAAGTPLAVTACPSISGSAIFPHRAALVVEAERVRTDDAFGQCTPCDASAPPPPPLPVLPPPPAPQVSPPPPPIPTFDNDDGLPGGPATPPPPPPPEETATPAPPAPPLAPSNRPDEEGDGGGSSSVGMYAAIGGAVVGMAALSLIVGVFVYRRRRARRRQLGTAGSVRNKDDDGDVESGASGVEKGGKSRRKLARAKSAPHLDIDQLDVTLGSRVLEVGGRRPGSPATIPGLSPRPLRRHWAIDYETLDFGEGEPQRLGRGAYGEVLCARLNGTRVAVKRYHMWNDDHTLVDLSEDPMQKPSSKNGEGAKGGGASITLAPLPSATPRDEPEGPSFAFEAIPGGQAAAAQQTRAEAHRVADVRAFEREMETLARLRHPNIGASARNHTGARKLSACMGEPAVSDARVLLQPLFFDAVMFIGACVAPPNVSIVMELAAGSVETLLHHSTQALPRALRLRLLVGAARGMAYLHAQVPTIIHMDLKPSNLLLGRAYEVKVADFGLSRFMGKGKTHMTGLGNGPCGTPGTSQLCQRAPICLSKPSV